jgi:dTDP-4-amino-4,6-dideoxygalactose transaminase
MSAGEELASRADRVDTERRRRAVAAGPLLTARAPLPLSIWLRRPARRLPFPLGESGCRLFRRARHGLWLALLGAGVRNGDEALVPAYHHGSEIQALLAAGLVCRFYDATETLEPDDAELERLLTPRTRALHLIHYLGFPQGARRWRRWCDERGLLLIEDAAQSWLAAADGRPVGSDGDIALYCLYKAFGVPDGGVVVSRRPWPATFGKPALGVTGLGLAHGLSLARASRLLSRIAARARVRPRYDIQAEIALGDPRSGPSRATLLALPRVADPSAAQRRLRNYRWLLTRLGAIVPAAFRHPREGAAPFIFPVQTARKAELLAHLRALGIRAYDLWPEPHPALAHDGFARAAALRAELVGLPVHHELRTEDLERIVAAMEARPTRAAG